MIEYSEEFARKKFTAESKKDAYMKAVKWVATNVIAKVELQNVMIRYEKDEQFPTVTVHLYVAMTEKELRERHCNICKEMHKAFFINENCNCSWCNAKAYQERTNQSISEKKTYYREILGKIIKEEENE